jgi:DtxR family transcriptional regulator, Mn-dependent transcriptional regulator
MITVSKEDYLKAILEAESEGEAVISATLAHWLKVSAPAVSMALRRLKRDGLVRVEGDGRVALTEAGRRIARRTMVRHHLIERMLHEIFGMDWYKVHDEAERLEHAVSADFEAKLLAKLGRGGTCPHGNLQAPETAAARRKRGLLLLSEGELGREYRVTSVYERDSKLGEFLEGLGIRPGAAIAIDSRNYDQTLAVKTEKGHVSLGGPAADKIWVEQFKASSRQQRTSKRN